MLPAMFSPHVPAMYVSRSTSWRTRCSLLCRDVQGFGDVKGVSDHFRIERFALIQRETAGTSWVPFEDAFLQLCSEFRLQGLGLLGGFWH